MCTYSIISTSRFWLRVRTRLFELITAPNGALWAPDHHSFDTSYSSPKNKKINCFMSGFSNFGCPREGFPKTKYPSPPAQRTFLRRKSKKCLKSWQHSLYVHLKFAIFRLPGVKGWIRIRNGLKVGSGSGLNHSGSIALIF